jgi:hypothetical protein
MRLLFGLGVAAALLVGCGGADAQRPRMAQVRAAQRAAPYPLYWAGASVAALALTAISRNGDNVNFLYGTCEPSSEEGGCALPVDIQTTSICARNALILDIRPGPTRRVRGITGRVYGAGRIEFPTGTSNVTVFTNGSVALDRVLAALRPVGAARLRSGRLPAPRYPLDYVEGLRRVRDAYVRSGSVRAVRNELGISQKAVRVRLRLARELGSRRLRRAPDEFSGRPCAVEPAGRAARPSRR